MSFKQIFFSFQGRLPRAKFFFFSILISIAVFIMTFILWMIVPNYAPVIWILCSILFIYPYLALAIKRFHDMNQKGIWFMPVYTIFAILSWAITIYPEMQIITYIYYAFLLVVGVVGLSLIFTSGTVGENQYGKDPIDRTKTNPTENITNNKAKRRWWRILALSIPWLAILWLIVSVIFYILWAVTADPTQAIQWPTLLVVIKSFINRLLWILGLLSIPGTIFGIILLSRNKKIK